MKLLLRAVSVAGLLAAVVLAFQGMAVPKRSGRPVKTIQTNLPPITVDFRDVAEDAGLTAINVSGGRDNKKYILEATVTGVAIFDGLATAFNHSGFHSGAFNVGYRENLQIGTDATPDAIMRPATFTIVPEPGSAGLLGLGLIGLLRRRNRGPGPDGRIRGLAATQA